MRATMARQEPAPDIVSETPEDKVEQYHWFNPYRNSKSLALDAFVDDLYQLVDGYEFTVLGRKRRRTDKEVRRLRLLVESFVSDLVYHTHVMDNEQPMLGIRSNKLLSKASRYKPDYYGKKFRIVLDALLHEPPKASTSMAWIKQELGSRYLGNKQGTATMINATQRFRNAMAERELNADSTSLREGEEVIILRDANLKFKTGRLGTLVEYADTEETERIRAQMKTINDYLERADIVYDEPVGYDRWVDQELRRMVRIFTLGSFATGGRLYRGFWQGLPRQVRAAGLELQGERTVTLDYDQIALRIAYSKVGAQLPEGDGYLIPGLEEHRSAIKKAINSMLFPRHENWNVIPQSIMKKLPDHFTPEQIAETIQRHHVPLLSQWWTDVGHRIQRTESNIIVDSQLKCIEKDITALQVHDALIIPESDQEAVTEIMLGAFERHTKLTGGVSLDD